MSISRPRWARGAVLVLCSLGALALFAPAPAPAARAGHHHRRHVVHHRWGHRVGTPSRSVPRALALAAGGALRADRLLVFDAKALRWCVRRHPRHPRRCNPIRGAVQRSGAALARAERRLSWVARVTARTSGASSARLRHNVRAAPRLFLLGQSLRWSRVAGEGTYVVMRVVPGQGDLYAMVHGRSVTPPPVPGTTVRYRVRTAVRWSSWSGEVAITYPPSVAGPDAQAAPAPHASGTSISWNQVAGVTTYVLAARVPGQGVRYSEVTGTSVTPPAFPGAKVSYSVRTAVQGSAWSPEATISYPASPADASTPQPGASGAAHLGEGPFEMGAVVGSNALYELPWLTTLGARVARIEEPINTPVSQLEPIVEAYARAGIRLLLLAGFNARMPSTAEAQGLASWAVAFGPGGSFWRGRNLPPQTAVTEIEFGNETNNPWQYLGTTPANWQNEPAFLQRAEEYARRLRDAQVAIAQAGANVGLLGIADQYSGYTTWVNAMFDAVPDLGARVAGWTVHPYGPNWRTPIDTLIADTQARGAPSSVPIYATEWGLSTDNGRCLDDNFGWNKCMSYEEAASTLGSTVEAMRSRYGSRLRGLFVFQARDQQPSGTSPNREYYLGALQSNMAPKGAYTTEVQQLLAAYP